MYNNKLVASIKANGRILREFKDTVYIPFGSEYSILLKNLNTARALVHVFIDGDDIVPDGLVLNAGQEIDLERSIKDGNLTAGNKLKFIERTGAIEAGPRGIKLEDGLVRVEFQYEKQHPLNTLYYPLGVRRMSSEYRGVTDKYSKHVNTSWVSTTGATYSQVNVNGALRGVDYSQNGAAMQASASAAINKVAPDTTEYHDGAATMDWNDVGITVPGSKSEQKFTTTTMGVLESEKHTIVLKLLGETADNKPVEKPVTVKKKTKCETCGKVNKAIAKFCTECGTSLEIFA
jgi:hypothetical protein